MLPYPELPSLIADAYRRISPHVRQTYLDYSSVLSELTGANVYLKCENLQITGSFKVRGATNKFLSLSPARQKGGIVAASTGNHGKAVAYVANRFVSEATVFAPSNAEASKLDSIRRMGATIRLAGNDCLMAESAAREFADENQMEYISPYNDLAVIAGQGTIGYEIFEQSPNVDAVYASLGGAGLACGISAFAKSRNPNCQIVACSPENSQVMIQSLRKGHLLELPSLATLSDGTAGGLEPDSITFELAQALIDQCITCSEAEIQTQLARFLDTHGMLIEGAAAVSIAGLLKNRDRCQGKTVVVILCGSNIGIPTLARVLTAQH